MAGCDGVFEECHRSTFDEGLLTRLEIDIGCEGTSDLCTDFDHIGETVTRQTESDCRGAVSSCRITELDASGRPTRSYTDDGCDGTPDTNCVELGYEPGEERPVARRSEASCDGVGECQRLSYDGATTVVETSDCESAPSRCTTSVLTARRHLASAELDWGCDGSGDLCSAFTYDDDGNLISKEEDRGCDDSPHRCETRTYVGRCIDAAAAAP